MAMATTSVARRCPPGAVVAAAPSRLLARNTPPSERTQPLDIQAADLGQSSCNVTNRLPSALQDDCLTQDPAFVGLLSMVTGSTLQEDIAATARQLLLRGRNILGLVSPETT